jgi:hypothetical protein
MKEGIRKNLFISIILLLALLLIALVIWIYDARIKNIEKKQSEGYNDWNLHQGVPDSVEDELHPNLFSFL